MNNNSYEAYKLYLAIKLHFTTDNYDFFKHNAKVNSSINTFIKRNDRYFFYRLATKYNKEELIDYFVCNFFENSKTWIGSLIRADGESTYTNWKKYKDAFTYNFRNECLLVRSFIDDNRISFDDMFLVSDGQHPRALRLHLSKKLSVQTIIILDKILSFIKNWDKEITEKVIWPEKSFKITKLSPFVNYNLTKCKFIMKEIFV